MKGGKAELKEGQLFTLALGDFVGDASRVAITYEDLHNDVKAGDRILIDDGLIEMKVVHLDGTDIVCEVINGGMISNKKGVNVPNVELSMPFISETDYSDIVFGIKNGFDFIAASFTRTADDICRSVRSWKNMTARVSILLPKLRINRVWITSMILSGYLMASW